MFLRLISLPNQAEIGLSIYSFYLKKMKKQTLTYNQYFLGNHGENSVLHEPFRHLTHTNLSASIPLLHALIPQILYESSDMSDQISMNLNSMNPRLQCIRNKPMKQLQDCEIRLHQSAALQELKTRTSVGICIPTV